jgi:hypothetical protein
MQVALRIQNDAAKARYAINSFHFALVPLLCILWKQTKMLVYVCVSSPTFLFSE